MAKEGLLQIRHTRPASADLSSNPNFIFANFDASGDLQIAGAGEKAYVLRDTKDLGAAGENGTIVLMGKTKVVAGGAVSVGDEVTPDANGKAVTATAASVDTTTSNASEDVSGDQVCGIALTSSSGTDELITILVAPHGLI